MNGSWVSKLITGLLVLALVIAYKYYFQVAWPAILTLLAISILLGFLYVAISTKLCPSDAIFKRRFTIQGIYLGFTTGLAVYSSQAITAGLFQWHELLFYLVFCSMVMGIVFGLLQAQRLKKDIKPLMDENFIQADFAQMKTATGDRFNGLLVLTEDKMKFYKMRSPGQVIEIPRKEYINENSSMNFKGFFGGLNFPEQKVW